ncbi:hypothetical protein JK333_01715 [Klebsiella michiganensis]|uniref:hypothetical protein n=1 Tax=Klebsiella michiganensis TaxID=1134687 RepID=UPI00191E897A|nr:hypothetical protein [Klebsiella michiganensis]MBL0787768.1 hypothetical protein [Klebsiella michiganensis]
MLRRLCFWALFAVLLFVAWRLVGMLMDVVLLVVILVALAGCRFWPFKRKS